MLFRNTRIFALIWLSVGLGLGGYYGIRWQEQPDWTPQAIEESVELNLAIDLARMGPHLRPQGERLERLRQTISREVHTQIESEQKTLQRGLAAGVLLTLLGGGILLMQRRTPA